MTMKIEEKFTVTTSRKEHPNAKKYPGRASMEFGSALQTFLSDLDASERGLFQKGELVFEEEIAAEFFDGILVGDVVGLGVLRGFDEQPCAYKMKILSIDRDADTMHMRNVTWEDEKRRPDYKGDEATATFEEFSCALGLGFGEILMRDGKPFGVSEKIEQTIIIRGDAAGNVKSTVTTKAAPATSSKSKKKKKKTKTTKTKASK